MAGNKYLSHSSGQLQEVAANQSSAGAGDAGKIPALDATGKLDATMMPVGIAADVKILVCKEAVVAGNLINITNDGGTEKAQKADCSNGRRANGFVLVGANLGANATVYLSGNILTGLTGKTPAAVQYLSTTGALSETPPSTAGYISQEIGVAISSTEVDFTPQQPITLA